MVPPCCQGAEEEDVVAFNTSRVLRTNTFAHKSSDRGRSQPLDRRKN